MATNPHNHPPPRLFRKNICPKGFSQKIESIFPKGFRNKVF
jgi:hypothetical protein